MPEVKPMVISIWFGRGKPKLTEFLHPFVSEMINIGDNGIEINGYVIKCSIHLIACDSPARSLAKGSVLFNHREGCQKCTVIGRWFKQAGVMRYLHTDCERRTNESFRQRIHPNHHKEYSILENLPIDIVLDFTTSDPVHLFELGVFKK